MAISAPEQRKMANVTTTLMLQLALVGGLLLSLQPVGQTCNRQWPFSKVLGTTINWKYLAVIETVVSIFHVVGVFFLCGDGDVSSDYQKVRKMSLRQVCFIFSHSSVNSDYEIFDRSQRFSHWCFSKYRKRLIGNKCFGRVFRSILTINVRSKQSLFPIIIGFEMIFSN